MRKRTPPTKFPYPTPEELSAIKERTVKTIRALRPDAPDTLTTLELATVLRATVGTIYRNMRERGHYAGLHPIKRANGRLLWPLA